VTDRVEQFNWFRDMKSQEFPSTMIPYFDEVRRFTEKTHNGVLFDVLQREYRFSSRTHSYIQTISYVRR